jgi:hypothetical protein
VLQNNFPMACRPPKSSGGFRAIFKQVDRKPTGATEAPRRPVEAPPPEDDADATRDLFQEWDARVRNEHRWRSAIVRWAGRVSEWFTAKFTDAGVWISNFDRASEKPEISQQTLLAIGQGILGEASDDVWTVVTAPNGDMLAESVACLVDPRVSRQVSGRVSLLDLSRAKIDVTPVTSTRYVATQPLSVGNARLIAAGWLSLNSLYYVAAAVWLGLMLAATTRLFVKNVGRRTE